nr:MAG TPA: hypothetical protein [Caudoviricetes sp.]
MFNQCSTTSYVGLRGFWCDCLLLLLVSFPQATRTLCVFYPFLFGIMVDFIARVCYTESTIN